MLNKNQVIQLRDSLNNEGYCQINNFFHPQLKEYLQITSQFSELLCNMLPHQLNRDGKSSLVDSKLSVKSKGIYAYPPGEFLLQQLTKTYSYISKKSLIPSYSYFRKYYKLNSLLKHKDRFPSQYAATIQIDSSKNEPWPIWIKSKTGKEVKCNSKIGDIIFYKGEEVEHWREELQYEYSSHLFLMWVDENDWRYDGIKYDGRDSLCLPYTSKTL